LVRDRPLLAITMGDPAGIGPEVIAKALSRRELYDLCRPIVVGDTSTMERQLTCAPEVRSVRQVGEPDEAVCEYGTLEVLQIATDVSAVRPGQLSPEAGRAAVECVRVAAALARDGRADAIVTAPLNKAAMHLAGYSYPGHTELLAEFFGVQRYSLVLTTGEIFVFHVTTHVSLREAIELLTVDRVQGTIELAHSFATALGRERKTIGVAGLNPHAGEGGLFGREDEEIIRPAIEAARLEGVDVEGPMPADALFPKAVQGKYDFVVMMYHDQGHVPFKSLYFDKGVNITVGLPVVRTSVDHGTAFDIAGRCMASEESMVKAIELAAALAPAWGKVWEAVKTDVA